MRKPTQARTTAFRVSLLVATTMLMTACAGEPTRTNNIKTPQTAEKALVGVIDGVYTFTIDPSADQSVALGASSLVLPANSVCAIATTSYGPDQWNNECVPETLPVTITAVVRNALTNHPSIEFSPAMRFSPARTVSLHLSVTNAETLSAMTHILYCGPFSAACIDESLTDSSLQTTVDAAAHTVSSRIKHFSVYVVAENGEEPLTGGQ